MKCLLCGNLILNNPSLLEIIFYGYKEEKSTCDFCFQKFQKLTSNGCKFCNKSGIFNNHICKDCLYWKEQYGCFLKHTALFKYDQNMHDFFKLYKRYGDIKLATVFSEYIASQKKFDEFDTITYLPSTSSHMKSRGFNPSKELFKNIKNLSCIFDIENDFGAQAQKNKSERLNSIQKFKLKKDVKMGTKVLIVDDIYTTGRTINFARELVANEKDIIVETFSLCR